MTHDNAVNIIADSGKNVSDKGQIIIKEMNRLSSNIIDYDYADKHYNGSGTVKTDKANTIKNSLAILLSDIEVYMHMLSITDSVKDKADKRLIRIAEKLQ